MFMLELHKNIVIKFSNFCYSLVYFNLFGLILRSLLRGFFIKISQIIKISQFVANAQQHFISDIHAISQCYISGLDSLFSIRLHTCAIGRSRECELYHLLI